MNSLGSNRVHPDFDIDSQRSVETVNTIEIIPMREYCCRRDLLRQWLKKSVAVERSFLPHLKEELALARRARFFLLSNSSCRR